MHNTSTAPSWVWLNDCNRSPGNPRRTLFPDFPRPGNPRLDGSVGSCRRTDIDRLCQYVVRFVLTLRIVASPGCAVGLVDAGNNPVRTGSHAALSGAWKSCFHACPLARGALLRLALFPDFPLTGNRSAWRESARGRAWRPSQLPGLAELRSVRAGTHEAPSAPAELPPVRVATHGSSLGASGGAIRACRYAREQLQRPRRRVPCVQVRTRRASVPEVLSSQGRPREQNKV